MVFGTIILLTLYLFIIGDIMSANSEEDTNTITTIVVGGLALLTRLIMIMRGASTESSKDLLALVASYQQSAKDNEARADDLNTSLNNNILELAKANSRVELLLLEISTLKERIAVLQNKACYVKGCATKERED